MIATAHTEDLSWPACGPSGSSPRCSGFGEPASAGSRSISCSGRRPGRCCLPPASTRWSSDWRWACWVLGLPRRPVGLRTRWRALPRSASSPPRSLSARRARASHRGDLAKRAARTCTTLDELCDRPAVRVRECGIAIDAGLCSGRLAAGGHPRHPVRLPDRQAGGHPRRVAAGGTALAGATAPWSAGRPSWAPARSPASGSPSRCWWRRWRSTARAWRRRSWASLARPWGASALTWLVFGATALLPKQRRIAALLGGEEPLVDLAYDVDPDRDHVRGPLDAPVTVVEYGDFECPYCGRAEPAVRELLRDFADVGHVWRHLPLGDVHPNAQLAAEASGRRRPGRVLADARPAVRASGRAATRGPGWLRRPARARRRAFKDHLREHTGAHRVAEDVEGADLSGVSGTLTFFINGRRHYAPTTSPPSRPPSVGPARGRAGGVPNGRALPGTARPRPRPHRNHPPGRRLQRVPSWSLSHDLRRLRGRRGGRGLQAALAPGLWR